MPPPPMDVPMPVRKALLVEGENKVVNYLLHREYELNKGSWSKLQKKYNISKSKIYGERFREHLKPPSPIYDHSNISGHSVTINNFKIIGREDLNQIRTIKEALYIRVNDPSLNRNVGKYHLPHVWDEVLVNTSELKLK